MSQSEKLFEIKPLLSIPKNAQQEIENWDFIQSEAAKSDEKENLVNKIINTSKKCNYCNEMEDYVPKSILKKNKSSTPPHLSQVAKEGSQMDENSGKKPDGNNEKLHSIII